MTPTATPTSGEDIHGLEFDWLGCDEDGYVALFSTAGAGYAPASFLADTNAHDVAIDAILALPASTVATFAPQLAPGLINTWKLVAERGLYAYDCEPNGGPYHLVAGPAIPIHVRSLPKAVADVVANVRLPFRFESQLIIADDMWRTTP